MDNKDAIFACRPVQMTDEMVQTYYRASGGPAFVYPGSIVDQCEHCEQDVYVGPMIQQKRTEVPGLTLCMECAVAQARRYEGGFDVAHLSNPYNPN